MRYFCELCGQETNEEGCNSCYVETGFDSEEIIEFDVYELMEGDF